MASPLPVIRGASAALYPFTMTISFKTLISRGQNGSERRQIMRPGLIEFEIPYSALTQAQKNTVKTAVSASKGRAGMDIQLTLGSTTYSNLQLQSDDFEASEKETMQYEAPLKLTQVIAQSLSPGTPGLAFPALANSAMSILPFTQRKSFQTSLAGVSAGAQYAAAEFGGSLTGYPADGLMGWILDEQHLTDADLATRQAHFIANWGMGYSFPFTDEDGTTYNAARYGADSLSFRYNAVNDSSVRIPIEVTNN